MPSAQQLGDTLRQLRVDQDALFAKGRKEGVPGLDLSAEQVDEAAKRNDAMTKAAKEYEAAITLEGWDTDNTDALKSAPARGKTRAADPSDARDSERPATKSLGELFVESAAFKNWRPGMESGPVLTIDLEKQYGKNVASRGIKALFDSATGWAPQAIRLPDVITPGWETTSIAALMPEGRTSQNAIPYMEETTTVNAAAELLESGLKAESTIALTEKTSPVRKIATSLSVTDESLEDVPMVESYVDTRLRTFLVLRENLSLLRGDGIAPNLKGIETTAGVQTQAKGGDPTPDAIYKAMTKVRVGSFFEPTAGVFHPNDWQDIRLLRTSEGIYIFGSPADSAPERIWGIDAVQTTQQLENTGLVGAFRAGAQVFRRTDVTLQIGWVNDQFTHNQRTILVEERLALVVFRPAAFCLITGI